MSLTVAITSTSSVYVVCRRAESKLKALYVMNDDPFPEVEEFVRQSTTRYMKQEISCLLHTVVTILMRHYVKLKLR